MSSITKSSITNRTKTRWTAVLGLSLSLFAFGCPGGDDEPEPSDDAGGGGDDAMVDGGDAMDTGPPDTSPDTAPDTEPEPDTAPDATPDGGPDGGDAGPSGPTEFEVVFENISDESGTPTPFAPGTLALHSSSAHPVFFDALGSSTRPDGLEQLAEDGGGGALAEAISGNDGVNVARAFAPDPPGPILPGDSLTLTVEAEPSDGQLSLASMLVQSNDAFVAPVEGGIPLFDDEGNPLEERDVADMMVVHDAGTEDDQAPWFGSNQAPRQDETGQGPAEGVVHQADDPTRALPLAQGILDFSVSKSGETIEISAENIAPSTGAIWTPVAPMFYALHDDSWTLFEPESDASSELETLAEDGAPFDLVDKHQSDDAVKTAAAATNAEGGPAGPNQSLTFEVAPDGEHGKLTFAAMVVQSNDVFIAPRGGAIDVTDSEGNLLDADAIESRIERKMALWDAGTERNEVPGAGPNQPLRSDVQTGPETSDESIHLYLDDTNDLAELGASDKLAVSVAEGSGDTDFDITIENTSDGTPFPFILKPLAWATHGGNNNAFTVGQEASAGLESLAEDGQATDWLDELRSDGVGSSGVVMNGGEAAALPPGASVTVTVEPTADNRFFNFGSMVIPSNDTFAAAGATGVALLDSSGNRRDVSDIENDMASAIRAYDAGTEADQAGAAGPDQPQPMSDNFGQDGPDQGAPEGDGTVRAADNEDNPWTFPAVEDILSVTIRPAN